MTASFNSMFNIYFFQPNTTMKKTVGQLQQNFKLSDLKVLFERLFPSPPNGKLENYRFIVNGIDLNVQNESEFNKNKHLIINGSTLYPLQRCLGGSDVDMVTLKNIVRNELPSEVGKILKVMGQCAAHGETTLCVALCCYKYCADCFIQSFEASKFKLKCLGCKKTIDYMGFFKSPDFIQTLDCLDQISTLPKHIDYQVCSCGSPMVNETMYAKQQCMQCKRIFCFFCNNEWLEGQMKNEKYTCRKDCSYEIMTTQDFVPLAANPSLQVPNKRVCPNCFKDGGYGNCCKYNQCPNCEHWFCYMCLKSQTECSKTSTYSTKCTDVVKQTYDTFPRLIKL
ncbi:unnamed protein product [Rotaria socialis]